MRILVPGYGGGYASPSFYTMDRLEKDKWCSLEISRETELVALDMYAGYKNAHVAIVFDISKGWIQRARRKLRIYGDVEGGRRKPGPKRQFRGEFRDLMPLEHC